VHASGIFTPARPVIQAAENYIYELVARAMPRKQARIFIITLDRARAGLAFILVLRFQVPALAESFDYHKSPLSICPNHFPRDFYPQGTLEFQSCASVKPHLAHIRPVSMPRQS
jgi:hypothetical protein